jgi:hypothetical protein
MVGLRDYVENFKTFQVKLQNKRKK